MVQYTAAVPADSRFEHLTKYYSHLLESWRTAAGDPDGQVYKRLTQGAPAGNLYPIEDPGILPHTSGPSAMRPDELGCDEATFRNYAGVEDNEIAEKVRLQNLVAVRTAELLNLFWTFKRPLVMRMPAIRQDHVSVGSLGRVPQPLEPKWGCRTTQTTRHLGSSTVPTLAKYAPKAFLRKRLTATS